MQTEKFADEIHISASGEIDFFNAIGLIECRCERFGKGLHAGMARVNECAVYVKQNEPHHVQKVSEPRCPARFLGGLPNNF